MIKLITIWAIFFGFQSQASECLARLKVNGQLSRAESDNLLPTRVNVGIYCDEEIPTIEAGMLHFLIQATRDGIRWTEIGSGMIYENGDSKKDHFVLLSRFPSGPYRLRARVYFTLSGRTDPELITESQLVNLTLNNEPLPIRKKR